ncbi:MAG: Crp/Fnr family transcriptional regulator [Pseudomonadota bacterium]
MERLPDDNQVVLSACQGLNRSSFSDGEALLLEGDTEGRLLVLTSGRVAIMKGRIEVASVSEPGTLLGEISVLLGTACTADVLARGPVEAYVVEDGTAFLSGNPSVALVAARLLARRLTDATSYLADVKDQFSDMSGHFGMMDRILDTLLHAPVGRAAPRIMDETDPRL